LKCQSKFHSGRKTYPAENTILLVFASSLEFTPVNIVFTMKVLLLLLLPLERERRERRRTLKETHRERKNSHMWVWAMEINDKKMKNR
jgi:hypothetical protein